MSGSDDILDYGNENVLEFIQTTIKNNNRVKEDILDKIKFVDGNIVDGDIVEDRSSQGFYYERLWELCIKFGVTDLTLDAITNNITKKSYLQTFHIISENTNTTDINFKSNCWDGNSLNKNPGGFLQQLVRSVNSGGYSDITFINQKYDCNGNKVGDEEVYLISVKYFKKEKFIDQYDIGKLCSLIRLHERKGRIIKLYIFVNNKVLAIQKFQAQHRSSNILLNYINPGGKYEHVYDLDDLQSSFFKLKKILAHYNYLTTPDNINDFQLTYLNVLKSIFIPRFHQKLFMIKINKLIEDHEKNILVGAIPRSGKSYIMAGTILDYVKNQQVLDPGKKLKFMIMTPVPNETFVEYEAIFNNYIEFDELGIEVVTYNDKVKLNSVCANKDKHCVILISKQKLGWSAGSNSEKMLTKDDESDDEFDDKLDDESDGEDMGDKDIKKIKQRIKKLFGTKLDIDMMFLDEAHFGMSTEKAQKIVDVLNDAISNTIKIYVTATYTKPLQSYNVKIDSKITWDMNDIQIMKTLTNETILDNPIKHRFGTDIYKASLEYFGDKTGKSLVDTFKKNYEIFPKPYMITSLWDKEFLNIEKLKIGNTEFGWDMNTLFATKEQSDVFVNEEQMKEMMRYYFGYPDKKEDYEKQSFYRTRGILPRIRNICLNNCRTLQPQHKTTQLWFLPLGTGKIKNKVKALINLLTTSNEFKDIKKIYHFFIAVDIEDKSKQGRTIGEITYMGDPHKIKSDIEDIEKKIKDGTIKEPDNLIILAGNRLQLGISLRNVDIVTLWNSISSSDAIFQMLFRSMTEVDGTPCDQNEYCDEKKFGFMVDMNPQRALTNVSLFSANLSKQNDDIQQYRQITDLINIDKDVLYDKYGDDDKGMNEFVKELFNKLYTSWNVNVKNIRKIVSKFSFNMSKLETLRKPFEQININKHNKPSTPISKKLDDEMMLPGKKKSKIGETKKQSIKEKEINLTETATELISEYISLLNIFTLYTDTGAQCILTDTSKLNAQITVIDDIDVLKTNVYENEEKKNIFLKILNGRLTGNANEPYPEEIIDSVLGAMDNLDDKHVINKIIMSQKKHYYTINEPDQLLEFINDELKPKEKERKENGEVFTPISLVNDMLDKLDKAYSKEHGKSIFTESEFKWFDPAVGIGNFPIIVYQRLMNGLKLNFLNEEDRRKHILENMLYSSELTPKNVFIYNKIFCSDKYKLNIYEGNTLTMDVIKAFKLPADFIGFEVILGNPPYNKGGIRSHTGNKLGDGKSETIWPKFIEKSFDWLKPDGFLVFINPLSWLKKSHSLHNKMLTKHIIWLKLWDNIKSLETIKGKIPISLYVLQNTLNITNTKTVIISVIQSKKLTTTSTEYLNPKYSVPLAFHSIFNKLVQFIETHNCGLEYKTTTVKNAQEIIPVKNKHTGIYEDKSSSIRAVKLLHDYAVEDMWAVDTYIIKEGIMVKKAIEQHPDANKRKLIISNKASFTGAFIDKGKLSLTGNHKFYILGENVELILKILNFKISDMISHYTKYGQDFLDNEAFNYIPDLRKLGHADITEDEFYKLIGFTPQEIEQIKNPLINDVDIDVEEPLTSESPHSVPNSSRKTCEKIIFKNRCEVRKDGGPMDDECELSLKGRCRFKKHTTPKHTSGQLPAKSWGAEGAEEVKENGYRGEPESITPKVINKSVKKFTRKTCKRVIAEKKCRVRTDDKPMDDKCELSLRDRCSFKKRDKTVMTKGGMINKTRSKKKLTSIKYTRRNIQSIK